MANDRARLRHTIRALEAFALKNLSSILRTIASKRIGDVSDRFNTCHLSSTQNAAKVKSEEDAQKDICN